MKKRVYTVLFFLLIGVPVYSAISEQQDEVSGAKDHHRVLNGTKNFLRSITHDIARIHYYLFDWDTYKTVVGTFPFYVVARMSDGRIQDNFYNKKHHKNVWQWHSSLREFAQHGMIFPVFFAGACSISARDYELKKTSRVYLTGFPFVMFMSNFIKEFEFSDACLRPWHEQFSSKRRSWGGFPSGHMAIYTYTAALYGLRFGPHYAVPLGGLAIFVAGAFLNCNRHYASQLIAGAGLGFVYAFAADKLIDFKLNDQVKIAPTVMENGTPGIQVGMRF